MEEAKVEWEKSIWPMTENILILNIILPNYKELECQSVIRLILVAYLVCPI